MTLPDTTCTDDTAARPIVLNGRTRLYFIVGDPIEQVKSPVGVTDLLIASGLNAVLCPAQAPPGDVDAILDAFTAMPNVDGLVITVPHKFAAFGHCRETTTRSRLLKAVNVMRRDGSGGWYGDHLDGEGFVAAVREKGFALRDRSATVAGAGGAGSAICKALIDAGVRRLAIHDLDQERQSALIRKLVNHRTCEVVPASIDPSGFDLVVNATTCGLRDKDPLPFTSTGLDDHMLAGDVVTRASTPWMSAALKAGCTTVDGMEMNRQVIRYMVDFLLPNHGPGQRCV